jgi:hypothetical protein
MKPFALFSSALAAAVVETEAMTMYPADSLSSSNEAQSGQQRFAGTRMARAGGDAQVAGERVAQRRGVRSEQH